MREEKKGCGFGWVGKTWEEMGRENIQNIWYGKNLISIKKSFSPHPCVQGHLLGPTTTLLTRLASNGIWNWKRFPTTHS